MIQFLKPMDFNIDNLMRSPDTNSVPPFPNIQPKKDMTSGIEQIPSIQKPDTQEYQLGNSKSCSKLTKIVKPEDETNTNLKKLVFNEELMDMSGNFECQTIDKTQKRNQLAIMDSIFEKKLGSGFLNEQSPNLQNSFSFNKIIK